LSIGLLFSGLCRGRLDYWVADVSAMLLSSSELVNKLVCSIPCWTIYMVSGGSGFNIGRRQQQDTFMAKKNFCLVIIVFNKFFDLSHPSFELKPYEFYLSLILMKNLIVICRITFRDCRKCLFARMKNLKKNSLE
jgi:hypothetical protein